MKNPALLTFILIGLSQSAAAGVITWTDWTSATTGSSGTASGSMGTVGINYTGDVTFAQLGSGTNYWTEGSPAPYTGNSVVDNAPIAAEMIAMSLSGTTNTVTFGTTVFNPIMAIVSQGQFGRPVTYDFDQSFTVLSEGRGYWGDGYYTLGAGDTLTGYELHAVIQFDGAVDAITWTALQSEYWHGFTFGLDGAAQRIPEPTTGLLMGLGLLGLGAARRISKLAALSRG